MTKTPNEMWARVIILHLTGKPDDPTPFLLKMIANIRDEEHEEEAMSEID